MLEKREDIGRDVGRIGCRMFEGLDAQAAALPMTEGDRQFMSPQNTDSTVAGELSTREEVPPAGPISRRKATEPAGSV